MPKFLTIGYGDEEGYGRTDPAIRDAAHAHDRQLLADGATAGMAGTPIQVRNHDAAGVITQTGPYLQTELPVAGFGLLEADTLEEAVKLASQTPCAVAQGVVEVWPLKDTPVASG